MAAHSSILAWKIPWTAELGRLLSMGSQSRTRLTDFTSLNFPIRHHQMINMLIIFFVAKDGESLYSQQKQDWELTPYWKIKT